MGIEKKLETMKLFRGAILIASIESANNFFEEFDKDFSATNSAFSNDPEFDSFWDPVVDITSKKNENFQTPKVVENISNEGSGDAASVESIDATSEPSLESS